MKNTLNIFFPLLCYFYPISTSISLFVNFPSNIVNYGARLVLFGVSLIISIYFIIFKGTAKINKIFIPVIVFWFFYSLRLIIDIYIYGIHFSDYDDKVVLGFAFGNILFPIICIILCHRHLDFERIGFLIFMFIIIANILTISNVLFHYNNISDILITRATLSTDNNNDIINPITISYYGSLLASASFTFIIFHKNSKVYILYYLFFFIGIASLLFGASRGPVVILLVNFLFILLIQINFSLISFIKFIFQIIIFLIFFIFFGYLFLKKIDFDFKDIAIFNRFSEFDSESEVRIIQYKYAWVDFLDSPIIGKQFVSTYLNFYPHNVVLELLMATGILGLIIYTFFAYEAISVYTYLKEVNNPYLIIIFLGFLSALVASFFSGSLFQNIDAWILLLLCLSLKINLRSQQ